MDKALLIERFNSVKERINELDKDGRVKLLLATKMQECEDINCLIEGGALLIGENKVNELLSKYEGYDKRAEVHFIGTLQRNKVKYIIDKVTLIHSVDSLSLVREINKRAENIGKVMDILIEINSAREESKGGVMPEDAYAFYQECLEYKNIRVRGLMTMGKRCDTREEYMEYFSLTKKLFDEIFGGQNDAILSMGMSESYEYAIEAGATLVRVGSRIFGERKYM